MMQASTSNEQPNSTGEAQAKPLADWRKGYTFQVSGQLWLTVDDLWAECTRRVCSRPEHRMLARRLVRRGGRKARSAWRRLRPFVKAEYARLTTYRVTTWMWSPDKGDG